MSGFLLISGPIPQRVPEIAHAVTLDVPGLRLIVFPRPESREACLLTQPDRWLAAAGTPFAGSKMEMAALRELAAAPSLEVRLPDVEGMFALVSADPSTGRVTLATDRLGSLHVYETSRQGALLYSTSSLLLARITRPEWDRAGCRQFLTTGTIFGESTLFEGIRKLPPAQVLTLKAGAVTARRTWWDLNSHFFDRSANPDPIPSTAAALQRAASEAYAASASPLVDLTGGYDSRCILAALLASDIRPTVIVNGHPNSPDVRVAKNIAAVFGLSIIHREPPRQMPELAQAIELTDGEYDALLYAPVARLHFELARRFTVSINGSNGEITKGYWYELLRPHTGDRGRFDARLIAARRFAFEPDMGRLIAGDSGAPVVDQLAALIDAANAPLRGLPNTALLDNAYLTLRMHRWQGRIASSTLRLWPVASPFVFSKPMEAILSTPGTDRSGYRFTRRLIEHLNPRLAALPLEQGYPALPLRWDTAHRFAVPMAVEFAQKVARRLAPRAPAPSAVAMPEIEASRPLYRPEALASIAQMPHIRGRVLTLELLARFAMLSRCAASRDS